MTGLAPTWVPAGPGWAAGCAVFRCTACGLWRHAPYDPKDGTHYPDRQPLPREAHVLLEQGGGLHAALRLARVDTSGGACALVQAYLLRESFDLGAALAGLAPLVREPGDERALASLRLVHAVLHGETGRLAWVAARDRGTRLALDERVRSALVLAMDRDVAASSPAEDEVARLAAEIRSRLG